MRSKSAKCGRAKTRRANSARDAIESRADSVSGQNAANVANTDEPKATGTRRIRFSKSAAIGRLGVPRRLGEANAAEAAVDGATIASVRPAAIRSERLKFAIKKNAKTANATSEAANAAGAAVAGKIEIATATTVRGKLADPNPIPEMPKTTSNVQRGQSDREPR